MDLESIFDQYKCGKCRVPGHLSIRCPYARECVYCASPDHDSEKCFKSNCFRCKQGGHFARECQVNPKLFCRACRTLGHTEATCICRVSPMTSPLSPLSRCLVCLLPGHLNCSLPKQPLKPRFLPHKKALNRFKPHKFRSNRKTPEKNL